MPTTKEKQQRVTDPRIARMRRAIDALDGKTHGYLVVRGQ